MTKTNEEVILVNDQDMILGQMEKLEAHQKGLLHRAFSIFIWDESGRLLLQQRATEKYHSGGLWTNTCCSHPRPAETVENAAMRRLKEEMGIECPLVKTFSFVYKAEFENGLIEHEYDHVFFGNWEGDPVPDQLEVAAWRWASLDVVEHELRTDPTHYTAWFLECWPRIKALKNA